MRTGLGISPQFPSGVPIGQMADAVLRALAPTAWYHPDYIGRDRSSDYTGDYVFNAELKNSLILDAGTGPPTFTRADGADRRATVVDFEGRIIAVKAGEARFSGGLRIENLFTTKSENLAWSGAGSIPPTVSLVSYGGKTGVNAITFTSGVGAGGVAESNANIHGSGSVFATMTGHNYRTRVSIALSRPLVGSEAIQTRWDGDNFLGVPFEFTAANQPGTALEVWSGISLAALEASNKSVYIYPINVNLGSELTIYITEWQTEDVTGQSNQNPGPYVSVGVLSAPYHGAGVDGVKYFLTTNGNVVV